MSLCKQNGVFKFVYEALDQPENHKELSSVVSVQGPVVQIGVSLTSSLRVISLTVLADSICNILNTQYSDIFG